MSKWFVIYMNNQELISIGCNSYTEALMKMKRYRKDYNKNCRLFYGTKEVSRRSYEIP